MNKFGQKKRRTGHTGIVNDDVHSPMNFHGLLGDLVECMQRGRDIQFKDVSALGSQLLQFTKRSSTSCRYYFVSSPQGCKSEIAA